MPKKRVVWVPIVTIHCSGTEPEVVLYNPGMTEMEIANELWKEFSEIFDSPLISVRDFAHLNSLACDVTFELSKDRIFV